MISGVFFLFASRKRGMFIDEIYTFGLSNSYYAPYVTDLKDGDLTDKVLTRGELLDYLTVSEDDRFAAVSVYYNQTRDVHPPLYYWLFNLVYSFFPGLFSMWPALALNYIIYMLTLALLYKLALLLFESRLNGAVTVLLYGLSTIGLSTALMIRMYVLITLFTVLLAYLIARLMREKCARLYVLTALTIFAGLMTQYYFVFYAFFLCLSYDIYALIKKNYKDFFIFSASALAGALAILIAFPACLDQLFADALVSGGSALDNLKNFSQYFSRIGHFGIESLHRMRAIAILSAVFGVCALTGMKGIKAAARCKRLRLTSLLFILPAIFAFALVAVISPVAEIRYIYNLVPMLTLISALLLHLAELGFEKRRTGRYGAAAAFGVIAAVCLWEARTVPPDYLYPEYAEYDALLSEYAQDKCVYIDDNYFSPITYDMLQLLTFDDLLVTNNTASETMLDYINGADELIVFIDINREWASGYDAEAILDGLEESTGLSSAAPLYSNGFSAVYLLKGGES